MFELNSEEKLSLSIKYTPFGINYSFWKRDDWHTVFLNSDFTNVFSFFISFLFPLYLFPGCL
jgi:hypothetical protein